MQLLKYLQAQGVGTRKECQWLIKNDCIKINDHLKNQTQEIIDLKNIHQLSIEDKALVPVPLPYFYILLNKPANYETSHKPKGYPSIFSLFPDPMCFIEMQAVGRLDADTTGIIIITNDGQFNHQVTSPKYKMAKVYRVTLKHPATKDLCQKLENGVLLNDEHEMVYADKAELPNESTLLLTISEGKYHQVKRMIAAAGNRVNALHRLQFGPWGAEHLQPAHWEFFQPTTLNHE